MAILNNNPLIGSGGNQGYNINNSLRFRSSASAYLNRTFGTPTNNRIFTWSGWVKRGSISTSSPQNLFRTGASNSTGFRFSDTSIDGNMDGIRFFFENGTTGDLKTTQVFRDPSAWYHLVVAVDTTQATAANRVKLYINGNQITAFSTATYPTQNYIPQINSAIAHSMGIYLTGVVEPFDGYMTDINFIDGQALTPSDFGETDTTTGVWKPKAYTGTYGTNGFYLKFSDIATTSGSNAGLGKDFSGNSNYWTTNNISVTSGTTYDAMTDSPTNTSATVANYAVLNPVYKSSSQPTFSNANLTVAPNAATYQNAFSSIAVTSGKWYCEILVTGTPNSANMIGVSNTTQLNFLTNTATVIGATTGVGYGYYIYDGTKYSAGVATAYGNSIASGDIVGIALDLDNGKIWFSKNGTWQASGDPAAGTNAAFTGIASDTWSIGSTVYSGGVTSFNHNFGQRPFTYTPPTGFVALNTFNLPTPTILQGNKYMDATLWTGNGSTQVIVNNAQFKPDLVWLKSRSNAGLNNHLYDSVRGANKLIKSNLTEAEVTLTNGVDSFNSNGFSIGNDVGVNTNSATYVGWQWQAGQGSTSSGTGTGGITSVTQSVNTTAGFSIVTYTGSGSNGTVTHGLGVAPKMIIIKVRNTTNDWAVYHGALATPATQALFLNLTNAVATTTTAWNSTAPTSSVFSVGTTAIVNGNTNTYVAYCFAEITGFSRFGSYTGNGSTDGTFVYTGFRPKFILYKNSSFAGTGWAMLDSSRNTYNVINARLFSDSSGAEDTSVSPMDFTSNGFKVRSTNDGVNRNADTIIYMAFAENPFKNSLAR